MLCRKDTIHYNPCWFFINAAIQKEMRWIKKTRMSCSNPKIILTEGEISKAEEILGSPIYFDQIYLLILSPKPLVVRIASVVHLIKAQSIVFFGVPEVKGAIIF